MILMGVMWAFLKSSVRNLIGFIFIFALFYFLAINSIWPFSGFFVKEELDNIIEDGNKTMKIANWNLEVFGDAKASKQELMNIYSSIIKNYDIVFLQEIRDSDRSSFSFLCSLVKGYNCLISSRAGRSTSKEQYGVVYREDINAEMADFNPDELNRWERPPIRLDVKIGNYSLALYNIHTKPSDVKKELAYLEKLIDNSGNVVVIGDLNADCDYYNPEKESEFDSWQWVTADNSDTSVSATNCAYDRIIMNEDARKEYIANGVYTEGIKPDVSDHYLVWAEINVDEKVK